MTLYGLPTLIGFCLLLVAGAIVHVARCWREFREDEERRNGR